MTFDHRALCPFVLFAVFLSPLAAQTGAPASPIHVRVVVVTMFERGEDTGDAPVNSSFGWNANTWTKLCRSPPAITTFG
jgi:hypothetical protein